MARLMAGSLVITAHAIASAAPGPLVRRYDGRAQAITLSNALAEVARDNGVDLLFDEALVKGRQAPPLRPHLPVEQALTFLLADTGLVFRRTSENVFVIIKAPTSATPDGLTAADAIPDILVIGRRAQNADIRRTQDDIQPRQVFSQAAIINAHNDTFDNFARARITANTQLAAPAQDPGQFGSTRSEIDLRGLGAGQTLVLVDGRRLPNLPSEFFATKQPDLNGLPIELVDRIEVVTAPSGGIYGTSATAGVVNVILKREFRGAETSLTTGLTSRGDGGQVRFTGRLGFTPDEGRTDVMLAGGFVRTQSLANGQRDFLVRARRLRLQNDPADFIKERPVGNAVNVFGTSNLVLDPEFGGTALGSNITTLPLQSYGIAERNALLVANAGRIDINLAEGRAGKGISLVSRPSTTSMFLNVRHDFGRGIVGFVDLMQMENTGVFDISFSDESFPLPAGSSNNPFQQPIFLSFPYPAAAGTFSVKTRLLRYTAGTIVPLPAGWRANIEYGGGQALYRSAILLGRGDGDKYPALVGIAVPGKPSLRPFDDGPAFIQGLMAYTALNNFWYSRVTRFSDFSARAAGRILTLPGGPLTLSILAEQRREEVPSSPLNYDFGDVVASIDLPSFRQRSRSLYAEARLPLARAAGPLAGLEFQLSVRKDWTRTTISQVASALTSIENPPQKDDATTAYTAGFRIFPQAALMLRGSVSTGALPPTADQIGTTTGTSILQRNEDPKRGGNLPPGLGYKLLMGGSASLKPEKARSFSLGIVMGLRTEGSPRISVDYTRIEKREEIVPFPLTQAGALLAQEDSYPDRVIRAPLTQQDIAQGFTGGKITALDMRSSNSGRSRIDVVDASIEYRFTLPRSGQVRAYMSGTWEPHLRQRREGRGPWIERAGYSDGPLALRGNVGADWSEGPVSVGINGQFYDRYKVTTAVRTTELNPQRLLQQGAAHVPAQFYLDLRGSYRIDRPGSVFPLGTEIRGAMLNLLDHRPPTVADSYQGYSYYGDARRLRFELTVAVPFGGR